MKGDNFLTSKGVFDTAIVGNIDGAVFSKDDLSFNGDGILSAVCEDGHGIVCKDDIVFAGGSYIIDSASHGIDVNNSISMASSTFDIKSGKDGFHCENTEDTQLGYISIDSGDFNITSDTDAISASYYISVADGSFIINAGGGAANASQDQNGGFFGQSSEDTTESAKGLKAEGAILIDKGSFTIDSADDALHSNTEITVKDGEFLIHSGDDGFHADDKLVISAGNVDIKESYEGLEAYEVTINGGDISIYASDDGINAAGGNDQSGYEGPRGGDMFGGPGGGMDNGGVITIEEGTLYINASGDGIDSNGELYINGGDITVSGPTVGDTATLDYATEGSITGGRFVGTGGSGMNMCFDSSSTQGVIMINAQGSADTAIILTDDEGDVIIEHSADQSFSCVILSCPELTVGQTYALTVGTQKYDITMGSTIYSQGGGMGGGMPGGGPGKGHGGGGMFRPGWN